MLFPQFTLKIWGQIYFFICTTIILVIISFYYVPDQKVHIYFLDVGQGDSIFLKTPKNQNIIIDGGPDTKVLEELGKVMFFMDRTIDLMILTHPHSDHIRGLIEILKRYKVKNVMFTGISSDSADYHEFIKIIKDKNINIIFPDDEVDLYLGDQTFIDILYPFESLFGQNIENLNNSSIALKIIYKDHKILLTGDDEAPIESEILENGSDIHSDIFKAGHHGSRTANTSAFLKAVKPQKIGIQCGIGNSFGHPHFEILSRLSELGISDIKRNDLDGRIEYSF